MNDKIISILPLNIPLVVPYHFLYLLSIMGDLPLRGKLDGFPDRMKCSEPKSWWTGIAASTNEKRISKEKRLIRLGITELEFDQYVRLFLKCRKQKCYSQRRPDGSWPISEWRWTLSLVLRHLCGETDVAIPFAEVVDLIMADIDFKNGREWKDVENLTVRAMKAIPGKSLIYQSSNSGGIRLIWFLSKAYPKNQISQWTTTQLRKAGIPLKPGTCEVRLGDVPDRLPFGFNSLLLDPITLEPLYHLTLSETIKITVQHREDFQIEPVLSEIDQSIKLKPSNRQFNEKVEKLLEFGLPSDSSTTDCLLKLAWYGRARKDLNDNELRDFLKNWIINGHNDKSDRINSGNLKAILDQIDRIIKGLKVNPSFHKKSIEKSELSASEIGNIIKIPGNFKFLKSVFQILCVAKSTIISKHFKNNYRRENGTNKWGTVLTPIEDITNGARNFTVFLDLGKQLLRQLKISNSNNPSKFIEEMERIGILVLKRKEWPAGKKVRQYWVNFDFNLDGQPTFSDFEKALWEIMGAKGIKQRFTSYQSKRISNEHDCSNRNSFRKLPCESKKGMQAVPHSSTGEVSNELKKAIVKNAS